MSELNLKWINDLGYEADQLNKNIFVIKNFLSKEEVSSILKFLESASDEDWKKHYMDGLKNLAYRKFGRLDLENMIAEGLVEVTKNWSDKNISTPIQYSELMRKRADKIFSFDESINFNGAGTVQRMWQGVDLGVHIDNHADPSIRWAAVTYLNDDYNGGELFFKNLDIQIKPTPGSLVIFPGTAEYEHGVRIVREGPMRYVIPSFISTKNFYERTSIENDSMETISS